MLFVGMMLLHMNIMIDGQRCSTKNYLSLNYSKSFTDVTTIVGVSSACTIFVIPSPLVRCYFCFILKNY